MIALPHRHSGEGRNPASSNAPGVEPRAQLGSGLRRNDAKVQVATDFEALFIGQLLHAAHAAKLSDDPLAGDDTSFRDLQDRQMAATLARAAPLGVAKLLK